MQTALTQPRPSTSFQSFSASVPGRVVLCLAATLIVAVASHIAIPLPFTPVPLTLQPLAVLGAGLALGPVAGFVAMVVYLLEGAAGLPVFSPTGPGGVLQLLGPTGGYLLAYPLVAAISGGLVRLLERKTRSFPAALIACCAAIVVLYAAGSARLMVFAHLSLHQAWIGGIAPFIPGELIKILAASSLYAARTRKAH